METQNKLERHHVAKRLPYGLKIAIEIDFATTESFDLSIENIEGVLGYQRKPILFPLSSLTETITINGESFVPIDYFLGEDPDIILNAVQISNLTWIPHNLYEKLLECHFDVDNLIEQNLAISVFDLTENPYA